MLCTTNMVGDVYHAIKGPKSAMMHPIFSGEVYSGIASPRKRL